MMQSLPLLATVQGTLPGLQGVRTSPEGPAAPDPQHPLLVGRVRPPPGREDPQHPLLVGGVRPPPGMEDPQHPS